MAITHVTSSVSVLRAAERELAAFLCATVDAADVSGLTRVGDIWIEVLESQDWPEADFEKFFRKVTILAAAQLSRRFDSHQPMRAAGVSLGMVLVTG